MTSEVAAATLPLLLEEVEVVQARRVSPSFVRLELASAAFAELGPDGALLDQRFKLLLPPAQGRLPDLSSAGADWWGAWQRLPDADRGHVRTYTIRERLGTGADTRIEVDVVVHPPSPENPDGPGARWAARARPGDRALVLAPRRGHDFGGIEWAPGTAGRLLLVGDETALPAVRGILRDLPATSRGDAVIELPHTADVPTDVTAPPGVGVRWLPRDGRPRGEALRTRVLDLLGTRAAAEPDVDDVDPDLWETPAYSSSGEDLVAAEVAAGAHHDLYAWIAGEAGVVTGLRRALVGEVGLARRQVAFMGYWREGVAMRS